MPLGRSCALVLVVVAAGCGRGSAQEPQPAPAALARCGGTGSPVGFDHVVGGADTAFYAARTRQLVRLKDGVEARPTYDKDGKPTGLTVIARDNSTVNINCSCPAGCSADPGQGHGCVVEYDPGGRDATCSGDCVSEDGCCFGCGWMAPR